MSAYCSPCQAQKTRSPSANFIFAALVFCAFGMLATANAASGQPLVRAWGNVEGIRIDVQLMEFETSLRVVGPEWSNVSQTAKEKQRPSYSRDGDMRSISTRIDSLFFTEVVVHTGRGTATVDVEVTSRADTNIAGAFLGIGLPSEHYAGGTVELVHPASAGEAEVLLAADQLDAQNEYLRATAEGVRFVTPPPA